MEAIVVGPSSPVDHLIVRNPVRVAPQQTLREAATIMRDERVSSVFVGDHGAIRDRGCEVVFGGDGGLGPDDEMAAVATVHPVRVPAATSVSDAAATMLNRQVRHLVVDRSDGSVAVVSLSEILAVLLQCATPGIWLETLRWAAESHTETWLG